MAHRTAFIAALMAMTLSLSFVRSAAAQDAPERVNFSRATLFPSVSAGTSAFGAAFNAKNATKDAKPDAKAPDFDRPRGSVFLTSLYATTALVQGLDAHSTLRALDAGARERNPLMASLTAHPAAFVALKAGAAAGIIFAGHRLARHSKVHAAIALIAIDSAYALIALHNYQVAARLR